MAEFVPPDADEEEAAAITAAMSAYLAEQEASAADTVETWEGERWGFAARADAVVGRPLRARDGTPTDAWTAASRADRL